MNIWPGAPYPLGSTFDGGGPDFAIFSEVAEVIELCLFDDVGNECRVALPERRSFAIAEACGAGQPGALVRGRDDRRATARPVAGRQDDGCALRGSARTSRSAGRPPRRPPSPAGSPARRRTRAAGARNR